MRLPQPGDVLDDRFRLGPMLGEGAFAVVHRATDLRLDRDVAIKLLKPRGGAYPTALRARFLREIRAMGSLQDPHTLQVFSNGETADGVLWFACELLGGMDLAAWINRHGAVDEATAVHVLRQLLGSIREAHAAGLIHRDIKPANVQVFRHVDDPFFVKLMDFGVAKPTRPDVTQLTRAGGVVGTLRFMPPEQLAGEVTFSSDIYALGVVMLDMLRGEAVPVEVINGPRPLVVPASAPIAALVNRMVEPDVERRLPSADAVLRLLDAPAPPPRRDAPGSAVEPARRRPSRLPIVLGIAFGVVAVGLIALLARPQPEPVSIPTPVVRRANPLAAVPTLPPSPPDAATAAPDLSGMPGGCGRDLPVGDSLERTMLGTRPVEWFQYVPNGYEPDRPAPVVFFFYSGVTATDDAMEHTDIRRLADELGAILVAPVRAVGQIDWQTSRPPDFAAILEVVAESGCVDRERVFALGHETGGHAAVALSCEPWVRAIATTGYRQTSTEAPCEPWSPKPAIMFAPRDYPGQPLEGGTKCGVNPHMSLEEHEAIWRARNECKARKKRRELDHGTCTRWSCSAPTVSCVVDGGLGWRGAPRRGFDVFGCDGAPTPFDYIPMIVEEFARHD